MRVDGDQVTVASSLKCDAGERVLSDCPGDRPQPPQRSRDAELAGAADDDVWVILTWTQAQQRVGDRRDSAYQIDAARSVYETALDAGYTSTVTSVERTGVDGG
jgi:hypothetical protein